VCTRQRRRARDSTQHETRAAVCKLPQPRVPQLLVNPFREGEKEAPRVSFALCLFVNIV
jgi:hypothetical protein